MTDEPDYGTPRYVTASAFLRILNPRGGKSIDFYGAGLSVPASAMTDAQRDHYLSHGFIERADAHGNIDRGREDECLSFIIATIADAEGCESWGRPRIAEAVRRAGGQFSNQTLGRAIKRFHNPPLPEGL